MLLPLIAFSFTLKIINDLILLLGLVTLGLNINSNGTSIVLLGAITVSITDEKLLSSITISVLEL